MDALKLRKHKIDFTDGCAVMGILNVTPDSFSDGGDFSGTEKAVQGGLQMAKDGAGIIDIGGESTRPGAKPISTEVQIERAIPVIEQLTDRVDVPLSIDTRNYKVAVRAVQAGAEIINDITAGGERETLELAARTGCGIVLMHMQGTPETMQDNPVYDDVVKDVYDYLIKRAAAAEKAGVAKEKIFIDPGIGFGKTFEDNLVLLKNIRKFVDSGYRVLVGTSRKGFLGRITGKKDAKQRVFGTAATVTHCVHEGVSMVRVHDVPEMLDVVKTAAAVLRA
jgi:dihydropteroate synthase